MPTYDYRCPTNGKVVEVMHAVSEKMETWGQLCETAGVPVGETDPEASVVRVVSAPGLAFPKTNSELKNMGFTKLVKRDSGVYENVTATGNESRYTVAGDQSSYPDFRSKVGD